MVMVIVIFMVNTFYSQYITMYMTIYIVIVSFESKSTV
jgi:hypothetical protein